MPHASSTNLAKPHRPLFSLGVWKSLIQGRLPGQVVIQYTDRCNASCVQCGMRAANTFARTKMDVDTVKRLLDAMAERGVQAVSFTGGEPMLCLDEIIQCIDHAARVGIRYIRTGTNGFIFKRHDKPDFETRVNRIAQTLAQSTVNTFWISVDSADVETHEANRGLPGVIKGIEKGLPIFHEYGLFPSANLGINRYIAGRVNAPKLNGKMTSEAFHDHFRQAFGNFYQFMADLGFTIVNACYPMSLDETQASGQAVYAATSADDFIRFSTEEKIQIFQALYDTIPEYRSKLRIFSPRSSLLALLREYRDGTGQGYACRGGIDFFFVDSKDGDTYPCGYRGNENLGKFWDMDMKRRNATPWCRQCDWECFRDPSELTGPLLDILHHPLALAQRLLNDAEYRKAWREDLAYYHVCGYFNARVPMDGQALARFSKAYRKTRSDTCPKPSESP